MTRIAIIVGSLAVGMLACAAPQPGADDLAPSPTSRPSEALATPREPPGASSSVGPSAAPPSLTPIRPVGDGGGSWSAVKGAELVAPNAVAAPAGDGGVLLVSSGPVDIDPCEARERSAEGTPTTFYDSKKASIASVSAFI